MTTVRTLVVAFFCAIGIVVTNVAFAVTPPIPVPLVDANIVNTPSVTIENVLSNPIPVTTDTFPRIPYQGWVRIEIPAGLGIAEGSFKPPLPKSRGILVIEQVATRATLQDNVVPHILTISIDNHEVYISQYLNLPTITDVPGGGGRKAISSQTVRLYHELSRNFDDLSVVYGRRPNDSSLAADIRISGYIVPEGSPSLAP